MTTGKGSRSLVRWDDNKGVELYHYPEGGPGERYQVYHDNRLVNSYDLLSIASCEYERVLLTAPMTPEPQAPEKGLVEILKSLASVCREHGLTKTTMSGAGVAYEDAARISVPFERRRLAAEARVVELNAAYDLMFRSCERHSDRADRLEGAIVELKTRYDESLVVIIQSAGLQLAAETKLTECRKALKNVSVIPNELEGYQYLYTELRQILEGE